MRVDEYPVRVAQRPARGAVAPAVFQQVQQAAIAIRLGQMGHQKLLGRAVGFGKWATNILAPYRDELVERGHRLDQDRAQRPLDAMLGAELAINGRRLQLLARHQVGRADGRSGLRAHRLAEKVHFYQRSVVLDQAGRATMKMHMMNHQRLVRAAPPPGRVEIENLVHLRQGPFLEVRERHLPAGSVKVDNQLAGLGIHEYAGRSRVKWFGAVYYQRYSHGMMQMIHKSMPDHHR
ncbi:MAG: hypothetical protein IPP18_16140 [Rhodocyclaceae bacterium]|nr:hypothetical protein [Rhodocyclaceae bacterium]